ncbi:MAG TPA: hypothetical protein VKQ29_08640 [Aliidongia sp.]|nr:hypothetical protein [Aliidongia sp.]
MHPLRRVRELPAPSFEQVAAVLAENVVFNSPLLVRPIVGRDAVARTIVQSSRNRGDGDYVIETKLDDRTTFLRWTGKIDGRKLESFEILVDGPDGLLIERTIAYRPYPALKLFREKMYAALGDQLPADMWDYVD